MNFFRCKKIKKIKNDIEIESLGEFEDYLNTKTDMIKYKINNIHNCRDVLSIEETYIQFIDKNINKLDSSKYKICRYKDIKNRLCRDCLEKNNSMLLYMRKNVIDKLNIYNQYISTIKDINYLISSCSDLENTIIKFGVDKQNQLICLFYDFKQVLNISPKNDENIGTIYVVFGNLHKTKNEHKSSLRINLRFDNRCEKWMTIYINQIQAATERMRYGHGTFALMNMEYIIKSINNKLKFNNCLSIKEIKGDIKETKEYISKKDLVKFYKKAGFHIYRDSSFKKCIS